MPCKGEKGCHPAPGGLQKHFQPHSWRVARENSEGIPYPPYITTNPLFQHHNLYNPFSPPNQPNQSTQPTHPSTNPSTSSSPSNWACANLDPARSNKRCNSARLTKPSPFSSRRSKLLRSNLADSKSRPPSRGQTPLENLDNGRFWRSFKVDLCTIYT